MIIKTETTVCDRNHIFVPLELLSGAIHSVKSRLDLIMSSRVCLPKRATNKGTTQMRKAILGAASALALASPAVAADYPVPRYSEVPSYAREAHTYEYRRAPGVVVEQPAPVIVVRRPVIVAPPPVVVNEYPVY